MQNILISGAASGIGAASARLFHRRGWRVGLLDIDAEALRGLAAELPGAWQRAVDVSEPDAVGEALAQFCADGRLRLLFNCAGILRFGRFEEVALEDHARLLAINLQGVLNCCHAAFPFLRATPQAQVLNMGSASGLYGVPEMAVYSASKFAVRGLTEALELEWRRHGIRVADLMPPFVRTPMVAGQTYRPPVLRRLGLWRGVSLLSRRDQGCSRAGGLELRGLGHSGAARQQMRKTGQEWANSETECAILVARMGRKRH